MRLILCLSPLAIVFCCPSIAISQEAQTVGSNSWFNWDYATGDWGGSRSELEDRGVTFALNYTGDFLSNRSGGLSQNSALASGTYGSVTFDFEKLSGISGLSLYVAGAYQAGNDLSGDSIGNAFGVAQIFNPEGGRLAQVYLLKTFAQDTYEVAFGQLSAGDDFATVDSFGNYVSSAVNGNPATIGANFPSFTASPFSAWGVRFTANPTNNLYWSVAAYNADPSVQDPGKSGFDFSFDPGDGVLAIAELGVNTNFGGALSGLPGRFVIGGIYDSSDYERLDNPNETESGNYGFYAIAEQMVYREGGPNSDQGLTTWAAITSNPDDSINTLPVGLFAGLSYQGLINGRDDDVTAFAVYYGSFSDDLPGQSDETVLELNHRFQISPSTYLTPDLQYVFNPNGGGISDAFVVGFEASIDF